MAGMSGSGRSREGRRVYRRGVQSGFTFAVRFHTGGFGSGLLLLTDSLNLTLLPTPQSSFLSDDSVASLAKRCAWQRWGSNPQKRPA